MVTAREVQKAERLPKRFSLIPTEGRVLRVMVAARCLGYVWTEEERWLARGVEGPLLNTGSGETLLEAVEAVFAERQHRIFLKAQ